MSGEVVSSICKIDMCMQSGVGPGGAPETHTSSCRLTARRLGPPGCQLGPPTPGARNPRHCHSLPHTSDSRSRRLLCSTIKRFQIPKRLSANIPSSSTPLRSRPPPCHLGYLAISAKIFILLVYNVSH